MQKVQINKKIFKKIEKKRRNQKMNANTLLTTGQNKAKGPKICQP